MRIWLPCVIVFLVMDWWAFTSWRFFALWLVFGMPLAVLGLVLGVGMSRAANAPPRSMSDDEMIEVLKEISRIGETYQVPAGPV